MKIDSKNIRLSDNKFIDEIYDIYNLLLEKELFKKGYESKGFKVWCHDNDYYILDKSTGVLITWWKLLGWHLASNMVFKDYHCEGFAYAFRQDLIANGYDCNNPLISHDILKEL